MGETNTPLGSVPDMSPQLPAGFVKRGRCSEDAANWCPPGSGRFVAAIRGIGGSGKTTLAAALCRDPKVGGRFGGGVLWAELGPRPDLTARFGAVHSALCKAPAPSIPFEALLAQLAGLTGDRPTLLVLDDVVGDEPVRQILRHCPNWSLLLTTRDRSVMFGASQHVIDLGELTCAEAFGVLFGGGEMPPEAVPHLEMIEKSLTLLPLLLVVARGLLKDLGAETAPADKLAALAKLFCDRGPFAGDRPETALLVVAPGTAAGPNPPGPVRSCSVAVTVDDCLRRLPASRRGYLAWAAGQEAELPVEKLRQAFKLTPDEALGIARSFADHALAKLDGAAMTLRVHPLVRAYLQPRRPVDEAGHAEELVEEAQNILRGLSRSVEDRFKLVKQLQRVSRFSLARRLLQRILHSPDHSRLQEGRLALVQRLVVCTYKDPDLPAADRLKRALEILDSDADLASTRSPETLGLAGAIHKRMWELDGQRRHLEDALDYYLHGHLCSQPGAPDYDFGYTGVNACFILDLLADQEKPSYSVGGEEVPTGAVERRRKAREIRQHLRDTLPAQLAQRPWLRGQWWFYATMAEVCFGLGHYDEARDWFAQGHVSSSPADWELESTSRQMVALAHLSVHAGQSGGLDAFGAAVPSELFNVDEEILRRTLIGKVGLALSGGGFRASLFHIGVLARLAELDVLRSIEVLSCVSGGSIIGARYYLEVRRLLETTPDRDITREHYIEIVRRVADSFLKGVQTDIRTRVFTSIGATFRMIVDANYTRTERLGELFEEQLFRLDDGPKTGERLYLNDLYVTPAEDPSFDIKRDNWRRLAKVPNLILSATSLGTGHNWQFTASFMGESPARIDTRVDGNERLRRMYYADAPPAYQKMPLGRAVAASACVPVLFQPMEFKGLYPDREVRLVDGGVHDNQGVDALLEQDCTVLLVSDASGQMQTIPKPPGGLVGVPRRSNGILQARVRVTQFKELDSRRNSGLVRGLMFIHLRKHLDVDPIDWVGCNDPIAAYDDARPARQRGVLTGYGVRKDVQAKLSAIRTDLDAFSDVEAQALMTSGYRMTDYEFGESIRGFPDNGLSRFNWDFLRVEGEMGSARGDESPPGRLNRVLDAANSNFLKAWKFAPRWCRWGAIGFGILLLAGLLTLPLLLPPLVAFLAAVLLIFLLVVSSTVRGFASRLAFYGLGGVAACWQINVMNGYYLSAGRVSRESRAPATAGPGATPAGQPVRSPPELPAGDGTGT